MVILMTIAQYMCANCEQRPAVWVAVDNRASKWCLCADCYVAHPDSHKDEYATMSHETRPRPTCKAILTEPDSEQRECGRTATHTAYIPPIHFCDECLHDCMEDASPDEQATVQKITVIL